MKDLIFLMKLQGLNPNLDYAVYVYDRANQKHAESYLLSLSCRQAGDQTGILGPLIGVSQSPQQTREILIPIGENLLKKSTEEIREALEKGRIETIEVALAIDDLLGEAVTTIRQVAVERGLALPKLNNMTLSAFDFWLKNRLRLYRLIKERGDVLSLLRREIIEWRDPQGEIHITDITQSPIIPIIPQQDFQPFLSILPDELNRRLNPNPPPINDPLGFLARLNMAGSDLFRYLVGRIREKQETDRLTEAMSHLP